MPQELCDFVLALALVYNDSKDLLTANALLEKVKPDDYGRPTADRGEHAGLLFHGIRLHVGVVNELLQLVQRQRKVTNDPMFLEVVRKLDRPAREHWEALMQAADDHPHGSEIATALVRIRNEVVFHYSPKRLGHGFESLFGPTDAEPPYVSRGLRARETRFHFADAAAVGDLKARLPGARTDRPFVELVRLIDALTQALYQIVTKFVETRGFAWRAATTGPASEKVDSKAPSGG